MELNVQSNSVDSADGKKISLEPPTRVLSGDSKYLPRLWVSREEPRQQFLHSNLSQLVGSSARAEAMNPDPWGLREKVRAALKLLDLREERVIIQFWSPRVIVKRQLLTTLDQPFGLGVVDEGLLSYRVHSEGNPIQVVKDDEEEDHSPVARVFTRGFPEWTSDLTNYSPRHFPQQDFAIHCNLHGYLALPVFDSTSGLCIGVLELLTSSKYINYAYEVQQVQRALKTLNQTSLQVFDFHPSEVKQNELDKIFSILEVVCEAQRIPLAQTWAISPLGSYVSHEKVLQKSCSSFNTKCVGKVCMYTEGLAFHVRDISKWDFRKACKEQHLEISKGVVGSAMLSHGSCFCGDVTKLGKDEYPLVYDACRSRITSCFAIFLHSFRVNVDYVLEFFLGADIKNSRQVVNLVQMLGHNFNAASGFELGDKLPIPEVGPPMDLSANMEPDTTQTSNCVADNFLFGLMDSSDLETSVSEIARNGSVIEESRVTSMEVEVEVTFNEYTEKFLFPISPRLSNLKKVVAKRFKLQGKGLTLKYTDEENDLISIPGDDDLKLAFNTMAINNSINLICILE